ncbi:MAG: hypothetical protein M1319_06320 [Chloroflexi bacterium]|nr:hypothetical protein [Chloroflexota bacterium]
MAGTAAGHYRRIGHHMNGPSLMAGTAAGHYKRIGHHMNGPSLMAGTAAGHYKRWPLRRLRAGGRPAWVFGIGGICV